MKCVKCGQTYKTGAHYCEHCGAMTAEGEMALALTEFATATKKLAKETARIGKAGLQEIKPGLDGAVESIAKTGRELVVAAKPAGHKAFGAATAALQLAAQAAETAAEKLRKVRKAQ